MLQKAIYDDSNQREPKKPKTAKRKKIPINTPVASLTGNLRPQLLHQILLVHLAHGVPVDAADDPDDAGYLVRRELLPESVPEPPDVLPFSFLPRLEADDCRDALAPLLVR